MKPMFAIQLNGRPDEELQLTFDALKAAGLDHDNFGLIPFDHSLTNLEAFPTDRPVIAYGSTLLVNLFQQGLLPKNWIVFYDEQSLDQAHYSKIFGNLMLNADAAFMPFAQMKDDKYEVPMFVKPSDDLKAFGGFVLEAGISLVEALATQMHMEISDDQTVLISPVKKLYREFRIFVVCDEFAACSQYRNNGRIEHKEVDVGSKPNYKVHEASDWGKLSTFYYDHVNIRTQALWVDTFALDVAETDDGLKIVELNCFNCSGMYKADREFVFKKVARAVEATHTENDYDVD